MKKFFYLTLVVAVATLAGFWGTKKVCQSLSPASVRPISQWYLSLNLSEREVSEFRQMEKAFHAKANPLCERICRSRLTLFDSMQKGNDGLSEAEARIEEIGGLQVQLEKEIASHVLEVKAKLNPSQQEVYFKEMRSALEFSIRRCGLKEMLD